MPAWPSISAAPSPTSCWRPPTRTHAVKVLTTPEAPERGRAGGRAQPSWRRPGARAADVGLVVHGTTLATNALIERKGARTALLTTEGFRDSVEIAWEHRFEQYDSDMERPEPLVPRRPALRRARAGRAPTARCCWRSTRPRCARAAERAAAREVSRRSPSASCTASPTRRTSARAGADPGRGAARHGDLALAARSVPRSASTSAPRPPSPTPMSCRGWRAISGGCETGAAARRASPCPLLLMMSSGGITTVETARRFPVRLVESGPAGGAILALDVAAENGLDKAVAFDMGGTTAKLCLLDDLEPAALARSSRSRAPTASCRAAACRCASR